MPREVHELLVKQALNRVSGMPFSWSLNPYRGCQHACAYCYARTTHHFLDLGAGSDFSQVLFAKTNLPDVLAQALRRHSWAGERVAIGTATDPYQPLEGRYRLTRQCLEVLAKAHNPVQIITKGTLIQRDLDLLSDLAKENLIQVWFSVPTVDPVVWRRSEPGTPSPRHRFETLSRLVRAGVPAGVLMAPLLPGISDSVNSMTATARAARDAGALALGGQVVRLAPLVKPVYMEFVRTFYPDLAPSYEGWYRDGANPPPSVRRRVEARMAKVRAETGLARSLPAQRDAPREDRQLAWKF